MGGAPGWFSTLWSLGVIDKDGEDVRRPRDKYLVLAQIQIQIAIMMSSSCADLVLG